jgi:excisionase family DNA binding protein
MLFRQLEGRDDMKTRNRPVRSAGSVIDSDRLLKVDDVADLLGVSPKTVYGWVYQRAIPFVKPSRTTLRFRRSEIEAWLDDRSIAPDLARRGAPEAKS